MSRTIIVGGGQAGAAAANALRQHGYGGEILLVGREEHLPYERPALSKSYLSGETPFEKLVCLTEEQIEARNITYLPGVDCTEIDRENSMVSLADGRRLSYDFLILATGGAARTAPGLAPDGARLFALRSRDDALRLRAALDGAASVLVIGGGWLGLELAATARALGKRATVIEAAPRLCARAAPPELSAWLADLHAGNGVDLAVGRRLTGVTAHPDGVTATLADGAALTADLAVIAIGLAPHTDLAAAAGLAVDDGILTDGEGRTEDARIFAIGDCARYVHPVYGRSLRLESWQNANLLADRAARAICDVDQPAVETPWFWSDQHGRNIQILGRTPEGAAVPRGTGWVYLEDGRLVGLVAIDAPREIAQARKLVADGARLDPALAADAGKPLRSAVVQ